MQHLNTSIYKSDEIVKSSFNDKHCIIVEAWLEVCYPQQYALSIFFKLAMVQIPFTWDIAWTGQNSHSCKFCENGTYCICNIKVRLTNT